MHWDRWSGVREGGGEGGEEGRRGEGRETKNAGKNSKFLGVLCEEASKEIFQSCALGGHPVKDFLRVPLCNDINRPRTEQQAKSSALRHGREQTRTRNPCHHSADVPVALSLIPQTWDPRNARSPEPNDYESGLCPRHAGLAAKPVPVMVGSSLPHLQSWDVAGGQGVGVPASGVRPHWSLPNTCRSQPTRAERSPELGGAPGSARGRPGGFCQEAPRQGAPRGAAAVPLGKGTSPPGHCPQRL